MGKIIYGTHIEVPAPFDAKSCDAMDTRLVVENIADLTTNAMTTFGGTGKYCFVYEGIQVYVREDKSTYMYVGPNDGKNGILLSEVQKPSNWRKLSDPTSTPSELGNTISKIQSDINKNKVTNHDGTIKVTPPENDGNTDIKVAIANADTNILKIGTDGLDTEITLKKVESVTDNTLASQYQLVGKNNKVLGTTIDIPKDQLLKDAKLGYANASVNESNGTINIGSAGVSEIEGQPQYLVLSMSIADGTYTKVVVNLSQFLTEKEFKDGLVLEGNVVKGNVKADDKFLGVGEDGFFTKGIEEAINNKFDTISLNAENVKFDHSDEVIVQPSDTNVKMAIKALDNAVNGNKTTLEGLTNGDNSVDKKIENAFAARKVNEQPLSDNVVLNGQDIKLDGYTKGANGEPVAATDNVNAAIGKLENQIANKTLNGSAAIKVEGQTISLALSPNNPNDMLTIQEDGLSLSSTFDCGTY
jgi:hypothetical protein